MALWITKKFWIEALERAIKTLAQTLLSLIGVNVVGGAVGFEDISWLVVLSASGLAFVVSILTSIASTKLGPEDSPSLV